MDLPATVTGPGSTFLQSLQLPSNIVNTDANTALMGAQTGYYGAQTQGQELQNRLAALKLAGMPALLNSITNPSGASPPGAPAAPAGPSPGQNQIGSTGLNPDTIASTTFGQFAPVPTARPPQVAQRVAAATILYGPEAGNAIGAQYDAAVAGENQTRQRGATDAYVTAQSVAGAPPGAANAMLRRLNPGLADKLDAQYENDTPEQLDKDIRLAAANYGAEVHQYTGRPTDMQNGVLIDKTDGKPVLGTDQVLTGLDAAGKQQAFNSANEIITDQLGNQMPRWKAAGFSSAEGYVRSADKAARSSAAAPAAPSSSAPAPAAAAPAPAAASSGALPPVVRNAAPPNPALAPVQVTAQRAGAPAVPSATAPAAPTPGAAPTAPSWASIPKMQPPAGLPPVAQRDYYAIAQKYGTDTVQPAIDTAAEAAMQQRQRNADAAVTLPQAATGPAAAWLTEGRNYLVEAGLATKDQANSVANSIELNKNLTQNALIDGRQMFGSRFTQSEVGIMLNKANPSTAMPPQAIHELLLQQNLRAGYALQKQADYSKFTQAGGDPSKFNAWYSANFPLQAYARANRGAEDLALQAQEGKVKAPPQAVDYLRAHPDQAPAFAQKYGGSVSNAW